MWEYRTPPISTYWAVSPEVEIAALAKESVGGVPCAEAFGTSMRQPDCPGGGPLTTMSPPASTSARVMPCRLSTCWAQSAA